MVKFFKSILTNRVIIGAILLLTQLFIVLSWIVFLSEANPLFYTLFNLISLIMVFWIVVKHDNPAYKISWIIMIFTFPIIGGIIYLIWGNTPFNRASIIKLKDIDRSKFNISSSQISSDKIYDDGFERISNYVSKVGQFPVFPYSSCDYYKLGEDFWKELLSDLKNAKDFIFMEYFIIETGVMWNSILDILEQKASEGVEVRVLYDDAGCLSTLPASYHKTLHKKGIQCIRFNPFRPTLHTYLNHRDHRKITVIDGKIGYMGGVNLADEYINEIVRFGHWKDTAIKFNGQAVSSLSMMFLELWEFSTGNKEENYERYISSKTESTKGFIQPFSDSPLDSYNVGENVYIQIINNAKKYVYIMTPYLILDNEMVTALVIAAQSGVDVRIVTPHIPDKPSVFSVTRSFYDQLIKAGVTILEYTPGFMHAKCVLSDDKIGVVGTINMDFRSFYMHFECGTLLYDCDVLPKIKSDFEETFAVSTKITLYELAKTSRFTRILQSILRVFSPMM